MLQLLHQIVQEVNAAKDLKAALLTIVKRVRQALHTQACSVFLLDKAQTKYFLMATDGLNQKAVGRIGIAVGEGLIGWVGEREEPINIEDAPTHKRYLYSPLAGEEKFRGFLGVPIIHQRQNLGVLVVQHEQAHLFDKEEEAFLVTISVQLAGVLAHAKATGELGDIPRKRRSRSNKSITLKGLGSAPGVGAGTAVIVYPKSDLDAVPHRKIADVKAEQVKFEEALTLARDEIRQLGERAASLLPKEEQALFEAYLQILDSNSFHKEVCAQIKKGVWAQKALSEVITKHIAVFSAMDDPYFKERSLDIKDLGRRVLMHLQRASFKELKYPENTILVGDEITASDLVEVPEGHLSAIVSGSGSSNSHVAILARALGIPTVMGVEGLSPPLFEDRETIVDGYHGHVYISPNVNLKRELMRLIDEERELQAGLEELQNLPAQTTDGHQVSLLVNTGLAADAGLSLSVGAEGVGLYRTEVPFMTRDRFPAEEEQRVVYQQLLRAFSPRPVTMRTLDVGGDKVLPYFKVTEANPFLGWRGIRLTLDHPEVFLVQVRAMLRASQGLDNLRIMLPMISAVEEVDEALELIKRAHDELVEDQLAITFPPVGVMIEVPAAVYQIRAIVERVDFVSVGSNDLTQYLLAVDRNNSRVARLYDALHPSVLHALSSIVEETHKVNKTVSICGEMASDPVAVILLLAMGFDALSMSSVSLPRVKWVVRKFSMSHAKQLLDEVLKMNHAKQIRQRLEGVLAQAGLGGLIRAGKN